MNLYLISQEENNGWDTYDSAVVCAETEDEARRIHPCEYVDAWKVGADADEEENRERWWTGDWALSPSSVSARLIGKAAEDVKRGVVLASFNAG